MLDAARTEGAGDVPPPLLPLCLQETASEPTSVCAARHTAYELATCELLLDLDVQEIDGKKLAPIVCSVIEQEGPIHRDEIVRRIGHLFGKQRVSPRIAAAVRHALNLFPDHAPDLCQEAESWFTPEQKSVPIVRDRSARQRACAGSNDRRVRDKGRDCDRAPAQGRLE
jgi:Protein of unknown function (DUF3320)